MFSGPEGPAGDQQQRPAAVLLLDATAWMNRKTPSERERAQRLLVALDPAAVLDLLDPKRVVRDVHVELRETPHGPVAQRRAVIGCGQEGPELVEPSVDAAALDATAERGQLGGQFVRRGAWHAKHQRVPNLTHG